jgi:hypothetical protein
MFTRESLLGSEWYAERLRTKQSIDAKLWQRHVSYVTKFMARPHYTEEAARLGIEERLHKARRQLKRIHEPAYLEELRGTLGADPGPHTAQRGQAEFPIGAVTHAPAAVTTANTGG